jgi:hypothetical protein
LTCALSTRDLMDAISQPEVLADIREMLRRYGFSERTCAEYAAKLNALGVLADLDGWLRAGTAGRVLPLAPLGEAVFPPTQAPVLGRHEQATAQNGNDEEQGECSDKRTVHAARLSTEQAADYDQG